jgi:glycerol-3-phosphate dehydrogenase
MESIKDVFIIGGGINGTGIAADASGRGLSVTLCEKNDLASGTSSCSTKLIHGGLRYLEYYEFGLVRKALREREILMRKAPHLISPLEFILPHAPHLRSAWLIRLGLFLYDHLAKRKLIPGSRTIHLSNDARGQALNVQFKKGFSYYDCFTDDARLVVENALAAQENQAEILTRTEFISAEKENLLWKINLKNTKTHQLFSCYAKALINASGPWVQTVNQKIIANQPDFSVQLVKGSHIILPKLYDGNFAYILQNADARIVFAIPYQEKFTLIGTTDVEINPVNKPEIDEQEKQYLCDTINYYFKKSISPKEIVWTYSGIRCLQNQHTNPSATTRDYKIEINVENNTLPLMTIIGGKITTFRELSEEAIDQLKPFFPKMGPHWTATKPLPGGDFTNGDFKKFYASLKNQFSFLPENLIYRYAKSYGTRVFLFLNDIHSLQDLGEHFGANLYQKEIMYLIKYEWAETMEDILWRRSKLGLFLSAEEKEKLLQFLRSIG